MKTKSLQQIQEENRRAIIMASYPKTKVYEKALEKELGGGCRIIIKTPFDTPPLSGGEFIILNQNCSKPFKYAVIGRGRAYCNREDIEKIIGKPLILNRILSALQNSKKGEEGCFGLNFHHGTFDSWWITFSDSTMAIINDWLFEWDVANPTLEEQSEDCQRSINKLLVGDE